MNSIKVILDGDNAWPDLRGKVGTSQVIHLAEGADIQVAALDGGMTSGRPSVAIRFGLPDGRVVLAETSMRLFLTTARAFAARYGWQDDEP